MRAFTSICLAVALFTSSGCTQKGEEQPESSNESVEIPKLVVRKKHLPSDLSRPRPADCVIDTVMIHFISNVVRSPESPYSFDAIIGIMKEYKVSSHYLIDRDGTVHELVPEDRTAFHAGKGKLPWMPERENRLNDYSIGIELMGIGTKSEMSQFFSAETYEEIRQSDIGFTSKQYDSLNLLLKRIAERQAAVVLDANHVVGHDEYAKGRKTDPGALFDWNKIGISKRDRK